MEPERDTIISAFPVLFFQLSELEQMYQGTIQFFRPREKTLAELRGNAITRRAKNERTAKLNLLPNLWPSTVSSNIAEYSSARVSRERGAFIRSAKQAGSSSVKKR